MIEETNYGVENPQAACVVTTQCAAFYQPPAIGQELLLQPTTSAVQECRRTFLWPGAGWQLLG